MTARDVLEFFFGMSCVLIFYSVSSSIRSVKTFQAESGSAPISKSNPFWFGIPSELGIEFVSQFLSIATARSSIDLELDFFSPLLGWRARLEGFDTFCRVRKENRAKNPSPSFPRLPLFYRFIDRSGWASPSTSSSDISLVVFFFDVVIAIVWLPIVTNAIGLAEKKSNKSRGNQHLNQEKADWSAARRPSINPARLLTIQTATKRWIVQHTVEDVDSDRGRRRSWTGHASIVSWISRIGPGQQKSTLAANRVGRDAHSAPRRIIQHLYQIKKYI